MRRYSSTSTRRRRIQRAGAAVAGGVATLATAGAIVASAAPPQFPDNIVVFPDRDFVSAEGFTEIVGQDVTVEVTRGGKLMGSAVASVEAGDHAFEVNHPGGACWGAGTNLKVTPDIRPGDIVAVRHNGDVLADTIVQEGYVDTKTSLSGSTLTVTGHIGSDVNRDQVEQRIVNPDLTGTDVARRDIRAVPGGLTAAPKGGYSSDLAISGNRFTATYVFNTAATAQIAANGGGERFMAWQVQDADANRQGLTIAEYGELGGPGMGGCPAGPADVAPAAGEFAAVRSADKGSVTVNWVPASTVPGAAAITGYNVEAIEDATGDRSLIGMRTGASATRVTISGLDPAKTYTYEVRSIADGKMGPAFPAATPDSTPPPAGDTTSPVLTPSTAPGTVDAPGETATLKFTTSETADIYYTTDGSDPKVADMPSETAKLYTSAGIAISGATELKWVGFDRAGNMSEVGGGHYKAPAVQAPVAATGLTATAGQQSATLRWSHSDASVTGYDVQLYSGGAKVGGVIETTTKTLTVPNLTAGTSYTFTVVAKNAGGSSPESVQSAAFTPTALTDRLTVTRATWKAGDFQVRGTSSETVTTQRTGFVTVWNARTGSQIPNATANLTPNVAPETGSSFTVRVRAGAPTTNPGQIIVKSSFGGQVGPITVTNG